MFSGDDYYSDDVTSGSEYSDSETDNPDSQDARRCKNCDAVYIECECDVFIPRKQPRRKEK